MFGNDETQIITKVTRRNNYFHIECKSSGFGFEAKHLGREKPPKVGDAVICHTYQGSLVRGVTLRGKLLYMLTDEDIDHDREERKEKRHAKQMKDFKRDRKKLNEAYDALPIEFQRRISWFRAHNPDFRWDLEAYEMSVCTDAVQIAETLKTVPKINRFYKAKHEKQQEMVPGLYQGHSGNSFGAAVNLARLYVQTPLWVILEHGALTPLTGCEDYGCAHPRPKDVMDSIPEAKAA